MRILVTGSAGFIGSHVVDLLVAEGCDVVGVDVLHPSTHNGEPDHLNQAMDFACVDLTDERELGGLVANVDTVCHQAAMVGLGKSFDDAPDYVRANDLGTASLLRALYRKGFSGRFVLASSMAVYGEGAFRCPAHELVHPAPRREEDLARGMFEPRCPRCLGELEPVAITEAFAPDPRNVYAATKLHQEHLCFSFGRETRSSVIALRYHNVYGPRMPEDTPYSGVAALFRSALANGRAPQVFEDGRQLRDFIHVRDVAEANLLAVTADRTVEGTFNIATGKPHSVGDMAWVLWEATGRVTPSPQITGGFRAGDVRHVFASPERARHALGFSASIEFRRGVEAFSIDSLRAATPAPHGPPR